MNEITQSKIYDSSPINTVTASKCQATSSSPLSQVDPQLRMITEQSYHEFNQQLNDLIQSSPPEPIASVIESTQATINTLYEGLDSEDWDIEALLETFAGLPTPCGGTVSSAEHVHALLVDGTRATIEQLHTELSDMLLSMNSRIQPQPPHESNDMLQSAFRQLREVTEPHLDTTSFTLNTMNWLNSSQDLFRPLSSYSSLSNPGIQGTLGAVGTGFSVFSMAIAYHDVAENGLNLQSGFNAGVATLDLIGSLAGGPAGLVIGAFTTGYQVGQLLDEHFSISERLVPSRSFMPQDLEAMRQAGGLAAAMAFTMEAEAAVWNSGCVWYLQTFGEHAGDPENNYDPHRATMHFARPQYRDWSDQELFSRANELPADVRWAVVEAMGQRMNGQPYDLDWLRVHVRDEPAAGPTSLPSSRPSAEQAVVGIVDYSSRNYLADPYYLCP